MSNETKMTLGASIILNKVLNAILFEDQTTAPMKERNLPFYVKYRLQRAKSLVEKDCMFFDQERENLVKQMGTESEDHSTIKIPDEKIQEYRDKLTEIIQMELTHNFLKLKPEDVSNIDVEGLSVEEISLFMALLIDDEDLINDLKKPLEMPKQNEATDTSDCEECKFPQ